MKAAWNILKQENNTTNLFTYGSFAYSLNLLFSDFKKLPMLKTFLVEVITIIKSNKQSHVVLATFKEKQKDTKISLKLPVETRWGSIVSCLESVQINKYAIQSLAIDDSLQDIVNKKHPI